MNCKDTLALIHDYLDGEASAAEEGRLARHLEVCRECEAAFARYEVLAERLGRVETEPAPVDLSDRVIARLKAAGSIVEGSAAVRRVGSGVFSWLPGRYRVPAAVTLILAIAAAAFPAAMRLFVRLAGDGTLLAADTYIGVQERLGDVGAMQSFLQGIVQVFQTLGTIARAAASLVALTGDVFLIPAASAIVLIVAVGIVFLRLHTRRSAQNAMFSL